MADTGQARHRDAAPARVFRTHAPGRPRVTVRPHYEGLPSMAGRGPGEGRRKRPGSGRRETPLPGPGSTVPRTETAARWRAARRGVSAETPGVAKRPTIGASYGAPLPLIRGAHDEAPDAEASCERQASQAAPGENA